MRALRHPLMCLVAGLLLNTPHVLVTCPDLSRKCAFSRQREHIVVYPYTRPRLLRRQFHLLDRHTCDCLSDHLGIVDATLGAKLPTANHVFFHIFFQETPRFSLRPSRATSRSILCKLPYAARQPLYNAKNALVSTRMGHRRLSVPTIIYYNS